MTYIYAEVVAHKGGPLLFLFHGTGGDQNGLIGFGQKLMPTAHIISPRGDVSENGAPRFFKRLGMGVYDMADLARATRKLAGFMREQIAAIEPSLVAALGYSNGANILASVLFEAPELVSRAVLMHPLIPFDPSPQPNLKATKVLITAGRRDPIGPVSDTERLSNYFLAQGAVSRVVWHEGGHEIQQPEITSAQAFLAD